MNRLKELIELTENRKPKQKQEDALLALQVLLSVEKQHSPSNHFKLDDESYSRLLAFPGWGTLREALIKKPEIFQEYLTKEEWISAFNVSQLNAFFTHPHICDALWQIVKMAGFKGGTVLEPGCGCGWMFLTMPDELKNNSKLIGIESDPTHAKIARFLNPGCDVWHSRIQDFNFKPEVYDLVIGNPPYEDGTNRLCDSMKGAVALHGYTLCRCLLSLKPGGLLCFVTSPGFLDARSQEYYKMRVWVGDRAEFLGAVRLPSGTFGSIGTGISPDVVLLRKK